MDASSLKLTPEVLEQRKKQKLEVLKLIREGEEKIRIAKEQAVAEGHETYNSLKFVSSFVMNH